MERLPKTFYNTHVDFQGLGGKCLTMVLVPVDKIETYFQWVKGQLNKLEDGLQEDLLLVQLFA
jgi:hypothetical protein